MNWGLGKDTEKATRTCRWIETGKAKWLEAHSRQQEAYRWKLSALEDVQGASAVEMNDERESVGTGAAEAGPAAQEKAQKSR